MQVSKWLEVTDRARVTRGSGPPDMGVGSSAKEVCTVKV